MVPSNATVNIGSPDQKNVDIIEEPSMKEISCMLENIAFFSSNDSNMENNSNIK